MPSPSSKTAQSPNQSNHGNATTTTPVSIGADPSATKIKNRGGGQGSAAGVKSSSKHTAINGVKEGSIGGGSGGGGAGDDCVFQQGRMPRKHQEQRRGLPIFAHKAAIVQAIKKHQVSLTVGQSARSCIYL